MVKKKIQTLYADKRRFYRVLIASLLFLAAMTIFVIMVREVFFQKDEWFDTTIFTFLKSYSNPGVVQFFKTLTFLGSLRFLLPSYIVIVIYLFLNHRRQDAVDVVVVGVTSMGLMYYLKSLYMRKRPDQPLFDTLASFSFPSGHALCSFIFFSVLVYLTWDSRLKPGWKWALSVFFILMAFLIGVSRIVLRYHYPSDVLAGFAMGTTWVLFGLWIQSILRIKPPKV